MNETDPAHKITDRPCEGAAAFGGGALGAQCLHQLRAGFCFHKILKDAPYQHGFGFVHDQPAVPRVITKRHKAAHPNATRAGCRHLVADALPDHFPLELREGKQDIQREAPHAGGGIEGLRDGNKGHVIRVEHLYQLSEIHQRARQAVDLIDHHNIN